jgi:hypothetical protein
VTRRTCSSEAWRVSFAKTAAVPPRTKRTTNACVTAAASRRRGPRTSMKATLGRVIPGRTGLRRNSRRQKLRQVAVTERKDGNFRAATSSSIRITTTMSARRKRAEKIPPRFLQAAGRADEGRHDDPPAAVGGHSYALAGQGTGWRGGFFHTKQGTGRRGNPTAVLLCRGESGRACSPICPEQPRAGAVWLLGQRGLPQNQKEFS